MLKKLTVLLFIPLLCFPVHEFHLEVLIVFPYELVNRILFRPVFLTLNAFHFRNTLILQIMIENNVSVFGLKHLVLHFRQQL